MLCHAYVMHNSFLFVVGWSCLGGSVWIFLLVLWGAECLWVSSCHCISSDWFNLLDWIWGCEALGWWFLGISSILYALSAHGLMFLSLFNAQVWRAVCINASILIRWITRHNAFFCISFASFLSLPFTCTQAFKPKHFVSKLHPANVSCVYFVHFTPRWWFKEPPTPVVLNRRPSSSCFEAPEVPEWPVGAFFFLSFFVTCSCPYITA